MKKLTFSVLAALFATAAQAQVAPSQITPGMQVYDSKSELVGAVSKVGSNTATVVTDKYAVPVNTASFALDHGKLFVGMDRGQLNAFYETNLKAAEESLAVGRPVKGLEGSTLGTIKAIDDAKVLISLSGGQTIELPRTGIVGAATGAAVGVSAADIASQLGASASASAATASPASQADTRTDAAASAGASTH
jgi:hypothetical protein